MHRIPIRQNRVYILENMDTEGLVKGQGVGVPVYAGPSRLTGALEAVINPIATN